MRAQGWSRTTGSTGARRRPSRVAVALVGVAVLAASCALVPTPLPVRGGGSGGSGGGLSAPCATLAMRSCALPYPNDEFTVADPTSATGRRLAVPDDLLPASLTRQLGPGATPGDAFGGADGYSALSPVVFELDRPVDPDTLPADGGDVLRVYDTATGAAVPIRTDVPLESLRHGAPNTVVMAWPKLRWEYGHRYVARVTTDLGAIVGRLERAPGMKGSAPEAAALRAELTRIEGDRWDRVVAATRFTVRSRSDATGDLEAMAAAARAADHPVRGLVVSPPLLVEGASALVQGEVLVSDFRDAHGVADPANGATPHWERFMMFLPERPAGPAGAPVVIYGHGLTISKESMLTVASVNARKGLATIGIDIPNHGDRQGDEGGYLLDLTSAGSFGRLASMPLQGIVDHVSLLRAITGHLAGVDLGPWRLDGSHGDGVADLDTTRLLYQGTSMGSVLGAAFVSLAPELSGAYLQVGGTGIADIIFHSLLWPLFQPIIPWDAAAGDAAALMGAATMIMDRADNVNVVGRERNGPPVFLQYGVGDGIVPNAASDRLMALLDLPLVGPQLSPVSLPVRRLATGRVPADGWGAAQVWSSFSSIETLAFQAHVSFLDPVANALLEDWLGNRLTAMGLPPT